MTTKLKEATVIPMLFDIAEPSVMPIIPEASRGHLTQDEMTSWYAAILRCHIQQLAVGDVESQQWFNIIDRNDPFSYVHICEYFRVDPATLDDEIKMQMASACNVNLQQEVTK
jgi:hypothetical protein